ncbi:putative short-chain dehydrogenase [Colletotrichum sojae]|uniref:Putative short-chain dehydrogenase n=1 Tax=Colletotrichum sojae TaxID=2175907 RepID=A0A8H6MQ65_9PEZI|nr:putative short-chain dehydrogenase [Colletotrichum sojae]
MLYAKHARVYIAARSEAKANKAIDEIRTSEPSSKGDLVFLHLDLADLSGIKAPVDRFLAQETKLHVLFNNAGILAGPQGPTRTAQGHEAHLGVNNLGTFLFTKLLTPVLAATAKVEPSGSVRVVWVSSSATEIFGLPSVAMPMDELESKFIDRPASEKYGFSKVGNWLHAVEYAKRHKADGVVSVAVNPGNLKSELFRDEGLVMTIMIGLVGYPPVNGACTQLYAGLSSDITAEKTASWVVPFGRIIPIRKDLIDATKTVKEGGNGTAQQFWEWSEGHVRPYC